jgi:hypothetical protein
MRSGALVLLAAVLGVLAVATTLAQSSDFCRGDPAVPPEEPVAGHHGEDHGIAW